MAFDPQGQFELPEGMGSNAVRASSTCLAGPVRHSQDVDTPKTRGRLTPLPRRRCT